MILPTDLQIAIEQETATFNLKELSAARRALTDRYRRQDQHHGAFMRTAAERCAYINARMPATYAVCQQVLQEILISHPDIIIESLLDLGAGPASASWAAVEMFPSIASLTLMEQDAELIALGKRLAAVSSKAALQNASWIPCQLNSKSFLPPHDVLICSYSLGELPSKELQDFIKTCWHSCQKFLVVIEPGTPRGFATIASIRAYLISQNAYMLAPCPHRVACPLDGKPGRWCHFSKRIERSFLHAHIKDASLGFEDEKFSYLIFSKSTVTLPEGRLLSAPAKHAGHVCLDLCTANGEQLCTISKRSKESYKIARKLEWGDRFHLKPTAET